MRFALTIFVTLAMFSTAQARNFTHVELDETGHLFAFYTNGSSERVCNVEVGGGIGFAGRYAVLKQGSFMTTNKIVMGTSFANRLASGVAHLLSEDITGDLISFADSADSDDVLGQEAAGVVSMIKELCD